MSRRRRSTGENLDSLLDTMANVVGILVILLAVTQISVSEAMKRIRSMEGGPALLDAAAVDEAAEGARSARAEVERLEVELAALETDPEATEEQLAAYREAAEQARDRGFDAIADLDPDDLEQVIARREGNVEMLRGAIASAQRTLSDLKEQAGSADEKSPLVKAARLPDPRPAPAGAESVVFLCRFGRCFHVDLERLFDAMNAGMRDALGVVRVPTQLTPYEVQRLIEHFARHSIGNQELRLRFFDAGARAPFGLRVDWRDETAGENDVALSQPGSDYRKVLTTRSPAGHYFKFYVWSDSFDAYLAARELATDLGFSAGWVTFPPEADLFVSSGNLESDRVD